MFSSISFPFIAKIVQRQTGNYSKKSFFHPITIFFIPIWIGIGKSTTFAHTNKKCIYG